MGLSRRCSAILMFGVALGTAAALNAQSPELSAFFRNRSPQELAALERGEVLVGKLADWKRMGLGAAGLLPDRLRARMAKLRPNYVTEFMAVAPSGQQGLEAARAALSDVKGYLGIVYHSKQYDSDLPLFDKMIVKSRSPVPGGETILTSQHMMPFEDFDAKNEYSLAGDDLYFSSENQSPLRYYGWYAVSPGEMIWTIFVRRVGDRDCFYGIGGMRAFDILGAVRSRLENSFIGRVEAFMRFMHRALRGAS